MTHGHMYCVFQSCLTQLSPQHNTGCAKQASVQSKAVWRPSNEACHGVLAWKQSRIPGPSNGNKLLLFTCCWRTSPNERNFLSLIVYHMPKVVQAHAKGVPLASPTVKTRFCTSACAAVFSFVMPINATLRPGWNAFVFAMSSTCTWRGNVRA